MAHPTGSPERIIHSKHANGRRDHQFIAELERDDPTLPDQRVRCDNPSCCTDIPETNASDGRAGPLVDPDMTVPAIRRARIYQQALVRSHRSYSVSTLADLRRLYDSLPPVDVIHVHISAEDRPSWVSRRFAGRIVTATYTPAGVA